MNICKLVNQTKEEVEGADELQGKIIKIIFKIAKPIAKLHAILTSPTGNRFRYRLLIALKTPKTIDEIEKIRGDADLEEYHRHINKLLCFKLIKEVRAGNKKRYVRTDLGEEAVNAVRALERKIGKKDAKKLFEASLGKNSIRFFLTVYGQKRDFSKPSFFSKNKKLEIKYKPLEIGRLALFLPRTIEGLSAIDKLNLAGLLVYENDGYVHFPPIKARSFYQYLKRLFDILPKA